MLKTIALEQEFAKREETMASFADELKTMLDLSSPRVVRVYGMHMTDPKFAGLVIEFCSLGDLRRYLDSDKPLTYEQKTMILQDIAQVQYPPLACLVLSCLLTLSSP